MDSSYSSQRTRNLYSSADTKPYKLSRSKIADYLKCPRCFYIDRKCGTGQPPMFPYTLNNAVDALLKKEFDIYRLEAKSHPLVLEHGIEAIPFAHPQLEDWRMNQRGIQYLHEPTNFIITGAVDDVWIKQNGELIIVDYKATSSQEVVTLLNRKSYKDQMEIYQWLFRRNGFTVSDTGYFFYCNGDAQRESFSGVLQFKINILPHVGNDNWIESVLYKIKECLAQEIIPPMTSTCDYCRYWHDVQKHVLK